MRAAAISYHSIISMLRRCVFGTDAGNAYKTRIQDAALCKCDSLVRKIRPLAFNPYPAFVNES